MRHLKNNTAGQLLLQYVLQYRAALVFSLVCVLVSVLFKAAGPAVLKQGVDYLMLGATRATLAQYSLLLIGIAVVQGVCNRGQDGLLPVCSSECIV